MELTKILISFEGKVRKESMNNLLSTKEVAHILGVNESSIKRWSDSDLIQCIKTPGGHRKFKLEDVNLFAKTQNFLNISKDSKDVLSGLHEDLLNQVISRNHNFVSDYFYSIMINADVVQIYDFFTLLNLNGYLFSEIFDLILQPSLYRLGKEWENRNISVDEEHAASSAIFAAISRLNISSLKLPPNGKKVIIAVIEGDYHEIPVKCLSVLLELEGWDVRYLGANTPLFSIDSAVKKIKPTAVLLSSTIRFSDYSEISERLVSLRIYLKSFDGKLIIGGKGMRKSDFKNEVADFWGSDFKTTLNYLNSIES